MAALCTVTTFSGTQWREMQTLLKKNMDANGARMNFRQVPPQDPENAVEPWVAGSGHSPFATYYKYVDVDSAKQRLAGGC